MTENVSLATYVGQELTITTEVSGMDGDINLENNISQKIIEVVGAIDPNDILVSPSGQGGQGFIKPDQRLTYTIRFQNVGTYYASRVVLQNQLSDYLDYSTFELVSVSHPDYFMDN